MRPARSLESSTRPAARRHRPSSALTSSGPSSSSPGSPWPWRRGATPTSALDRALDRPQGGDEPGAGLRHADRGRASCEAASAASSRREACARPSSSRPSAQRWTTRASRRSAADELPAIHVEISVLGPLDSHRRHRRVPAGGRWRHRRTERATRAAAAGGRDDVPWAATRDVRRRVPEGRTAARRVARSDRRDSARSGRSGSAVRPRASTRWRSGGASRAVASRRDRAGARPAAGPAPRPERPPRGAAGSIRPPR